MRRRSRLGAIVFVVVVGIAATAVGVSATVPSVMTDEHTPGISVTNSTNYLSPSTENTTRQVYERADVDVAGAIAVDAERLEGEHRRMILDTQLSTGGNTTDIARDTVAEIEAKVSELDQRQNQLFEQFSAGEISNERLVRELAQLEVTADQYRELSRFARTQSRIPDDTSLSRRYRNLASETPLLSSPLSERIEGVITGTADPLTVYFQSADDALVMATANGSKYLRQATVRTNRDRTATDRFRASDLPAPQAAFERANELYPWTANDVLAPNVQGYGNSSVYLFSANHSHGELNTYLDGKTQAPFHENQRKDPGSVPISSTTTNTENDLRLIVQSTAATGPMLINLVGTGSDAPSEVTLTINGHPIGTVAVGEELWTVQPLGEFQVTALTDGNATVSVTVP
jgi:hypothetical protein